MPNAQEIEAAARAVHKENGKHAFLPEEAFVSYCENICTELPDSETLEEASELYAGEFKSFTELAEQQVDEGLWGNIPEHLANYIDCEAIGRDLRIGGDYWENNGFYFRNC